MINDNDKNLNTIIANQVLKELLETSLFNALFAKFR